MPPREEEVDALSRNEPPVSKEREYLVPEEELGWMTPTMPGLATGTSTAAAIISRLPASCADSWGGEPALMRYGYDGGDAVWAAAVEELSRGYHSDGPSPEPDRGVFYGGESLAAACQRLVRTCGVRGLSV